MNDTLLQQADALMRRGGLGGSAQPSLAPAAEPPSESESATGPVSIPDPAPATAGDGTAPTGKRLYDLDDDDIPELTETAEFPADATAPAPDVPTLTDTIDTIDTQGAETPVRVAAALAGGPDDAAAPIAAANLDDQALVALLDRTLEERLAERLREQRSRIDNEIERWLDENLPQLVGQAVSDIGERMTREIRQHIRARLAPTAETDDPG